MTKHQQRQILELLQTVRDAQEAELYADCQCGALAVGEFIEAIEGEGTQTVALLEQYCDLVYNVSNGEAGKNVLTRELINIENSIKSELKPDKKEMVFLSYKASMSDSLESIYLAARSDPQCEAYWIPIPYVDRRNDGSQGETYFEGAEFYSDSFICTDYREYDIEMRHPDVIFTYAPYDGNNYITSVHPDYYCTRLQGLTDCLVYVPYFVVDGREVDRTLCINMGCIVSDIVIVQSEEVRESYIKHLKEYLDEHGGGRFGDPGHRIIALGSPKFDKVINSGREDFVLPEKWESLIGGKKAILYNTSVMAIYEGDRQYIIKLRGVLDTFRKRDDVTLWWRPHPHSVSTIKSMCPHLLDDYLKIADEYKRENWGIYDDTPDLHRAIACTDGYYGDHSSLVALYRVTGKPVMLQTV